MLGISEHRTASVVTLSVCDVRIVHKKDFQVALTLFPQERARFRKEAERRMAEIKRKEAQDIASKDPESVSRKQGRRSSRRVAPVLRKLQSQGYIIDDTPSPWRRHSQSGALSQPSSPQLPTPRRRSTGSTPHTFSGLTLSEPASPPLNVQGSATNGFSDRQTSTLCTGVSGQHHSSGEMPVADQAPITASKMLNRRFTSEMASAERGMHLDLESSIPQRQTDALDEFLACDDTSRFRSDKNGLSETSPMTSS
jgi:hypothetical protein